MIGIYKIVINSSYYYIGSCVDFEKRKKLHFRQLERGKHHNKRMQNLFNKGYEFNMKFVEAVDRSVLYDREEVLVRESWDDPNCINLSKSTKNPVYDRTPETIDKQLATKARTGNWGGANENSWAAAAAANTGIKRSSEAKQKMSDAKRKFIKNNPDFYKEALDKGRRNRWAKVCKPFVLIKDGIEYGPYKTCHEVDILSHPSVLALKNGKKESIKGYSFKLI